jgi:hypothetical protein
MTPDDLNRKHYERKLMWLDDNIKAAEGKESYRGWKTSYNNGVMIEADS